jgi:hypothetical protein
LFEAYSVAVRVVLHNGVAPGLLAMAAEFRRAEGDAAGLHRRLAGIRTTMMAGFGMGAVGVGMFAALRPALEQAKEFQTAVANFSTFGLGDKMTGDAAKFAKGMNVVGSSYVDNMKRMVEAQGVFRESGLSGPDALRGAEIAAPLLSKIAFANAALHPDKAGQMDTNALAMMRFVEMRGGVNDPKQFNTIANLGYKAIQTSGGNVSWDLYRQFMATGGVAAQGMNNKALFGEMEPIIGELKSRAGTAYMTAFNRLTGITRVPNQVAHELVNQGLWDGSKIEWNSQGGIKTMRGNPLKDMGTFSASQIEWYVKNVIPMYDRMKLSDPDRNREDALLGGRTGGMMFSIIRRQLGPIGLSVAAQAKAMDIDQAGGAAANTLLGKQIILHKRWNDLLELTGETILPLAVQGLSTLVPLLKEFSTWAQRHPGYFAAVVRSFAALGVTLIGGGVITGLVATAQAFRLIGGALSVGKLLGFARGAAAVGEAATVAEAAIGVGGAVAGGGLIAGLAGIATVIGTIVIPAVVALAGAASLIKVFRQDHDYKWTMDHLIQATPEELSSARAYALSYRQSVNNQIDAHPYTNRGMGAAVSHWQSGIDAVDNELNARAQWSKTHPAGQPYVPSAANQNMTVVVPVSVDGKKIAEASARVFNQQFGANSGGMGRFDPAAALPSVGAGYAR